MIRAAAAALLGALAGAVWLALFFTAGATGARGAGGGGLRIDFEVDPPRLVSGFYPAERDAASDMTFAWTGPEAGVRLPGLDRRAAWTLVVRARGGRAGAAANPSLAFYVDGLQVHTQQTAAAFEDIRVLVPPRPERRGVSILMRTSSTFVPGRGDPRSLGVMVDAIDLTPDDIVLPPPDHLGMAMLSGAALGAALAFLGITAGAAIGAAVLLTAGQGAVLAYGFAPYTNYAQTASRLALLAAAILILAPWFIVRWRQAPLRNTARFAIAFSAGACFLQLLVLLHPNMPIGDALFQAHRFQDVLRGNLYFTSVAPGGYAFPYAPGLYVAAWPFSGLVRREMGDVALLRIVTVAVNAAAGILLYFVAARAWHDRLAAAIAVAVYQLVPLSFRIIAVGNLTNAFAESLTVGALASLAAPALRAPMSTATGILLLVLTAAFLSHTSTFAILAVSVAATAGLFWWKGGSELRPAARAAALGLTLAAGLAIAVYYAHFVETYRAELTRLGSETATAAPDAGGRGTIERAAAVPRYLHMYLGVPALVLAAAGAVERWRSGSRDRLTLAVAGWGFACALFLAIGVLTPLDMRYYLAIIPALALLAAAGASWWWNVGGAARALAAALLAWIVWVGVMTWWSTLRL